MSTTFAQKKKYKDVFGGVKAATAVSAIKLGQDFPVVEFTLFPAFTGALSAVVGTFVVGETVTGGTSAATGVIAAFTSTTITLIKVVGTFQNAETITGGTSAAHATLGSVSVPNFTIGAFTSENIVNGKNTIPDPTLPPSSSNDYSQVVYSNESNGVNYSVGFEYNPTVSGVTDYTPYVFRLGTDGQPVTGKFVFLEILAFTGGALVDADINLSNL